MSLSNKPILPPLVINKTPRLRKVSSMASQMSLRTIPEVSETDENWNGVFRPPHMKAGSGHKRNGMADLSLQITTTPPIPLIVEDLCGSPDSFHRTFKSLSPSFPTPPSLSSVPDLLHSANSSPSSPSSSYSDLPETPEETPFQSLENLTVPKPSRPVITPLIITKHAFKGIVDFSNSPLYTADSHVSFMDADDSDEEEEEQNDDDDDDASFYSEQLSARVTLTSPFGFPSTPLPYSPLLSAELPPARRDSCNSVIPLNPAKPPPSARALPKTPKTVKRPSSALDPSFVFAKPAPRRPPRVEVPADILEEDDTFGLSTASRMSGMRMNVSMQGDDIFFDALGSASRRTSNASTVRQSSIAPRYQRPSLLSLTPPSPLGHSSLSLDIPTTAASISTFDFSFAPTTPLPPMTFESISPYTKTPSTSSSVSTPLTSYPPSAFPRSAFPESAMASANDSELQAQQQASLMRSRWSTSTVNTLPQKLYVPPRVSTQDLPKTPISATPSGIFKSYFSRRIHSNSPA